MRTNYVLIDYENVQPDDLAALDHEHFKVIVFVGANQSKVRLKIVTALHSMGDRAKYFQISGNGSNALDFHIAYTIGRLAAEDPTAFFHIISRDQGFKPLIEHLKTQKIFSALWRDVGEIPLVKAVATSPKDRLAAIVGKLRTMSKTRPATVKTLTKTIESLFLKQLTPEEIEGLVKLLQSRKIVTVTGNKVTYTLPD